MGSTLAGMTRSRPSLPVVAFVWDFDRTLIVGDQQEPLFAAYGVDADAFWAEVEALPAYHRERGEVISRDAAYLLHLLSYVEAGVFPGLDNARLRALGGRLRPSPGIPDFLEATRRRAASLATASARRLTVEHYVISAGLRPMVEGSPIAAHLDGIWASSFVAHAAPPGFLGRPGEVEKAGRILRPGCVIDNTAKTRALFEINKGANRDPAVDVHAHMSAPERRVPFERMIYIGDGPSDVPVFSLLNERGGRTLGVYQTEPRSNYRQVVELREQGRIQAVAEADFRPGTAAHRWLMDCLEEIAGGI